MLTFDFVLVVHLRRLQKLLNHAYTTEPAQSTISSKNCHFNAKHNKVPYSSYDAVCNKLSFIIVTKALKF